MEKKTIRIATNGVADELRNMEVGEIVQFPFDKYNYNSVRSTPSTALVKERAEGRSWKSRANYEGKCAEVIRIS